jgi:glycosyltransferase involved in cell wall biosynthesis
VSERAISVVIPTHARAEALRETLEALRLQEEGLADAEVIVVSDGRDAPTMRMVQELAADFPCTLEVLEQEQAGQGNARNRGIAHATGRLVLMLDDDITADPRLLRAHLAAHGNRDDRIVIGALPVRRIDAEPAHHRVVREWWEAELARMRAPGYEGSFRDFVTGNVSVARSQLLAVGGFDRDFTGYGREDYELGYRLERRGLRFVHAPDAVGEHRYRKSPVTWLRQFESIGKADVLFARKHPEAMPIVISLTSLPRAAWRPALVAAGERIVTSTNRRGGRAWAAAAAIVQGAYYWRGIALEARDERELEWLIEGYEARQRRDRIGRVLAEVAKHAPAPPPAYVRDLLEPVISPRPTISVVIPAYNHARFLPDAIRSVEAPKGADVEIIVVDDGSIDDSAAVARAEGVRCIVQRNRGVASARNAGLAATRGEYVAFLDADDRLLPEALQRALDAFAIEPGAAFVAGAFHYIDEKGDFIRPSRKPLVTRDHRCHLLESNFIAMHATVMYRRDFLSAIGAFDETLNACDDYDVYLRVARSFPIRCHDAVVAEYRLHGANKSSNAAGMLDGVMRVLLRHRPRHDEAKELQEAWRRGVAFYRDFYGEQAAFDLGARLRSPGTRSRALRELFVLARRHPRALVNHALQKLPFARRPMREAL